MMTIKATISVQTTLSEKLFDSMLDIKDMTEDTYKELYADQLEKASANYLNSADEITDITVMIERAGGNTDV